MPFSVHSLPNAVFALVLSSASRLLQNQIALVARICCVAGFRIRKIHWKENGTTKEAMVVKSHAASRNLGVQSWSPGSTKRTQQLWARTLLTERKLLSPRDPEWFHKITLRGGMRVTGPSLPSVILWLQCRTRNRGTPVRIPILPWNSQGILGPHYPISALFTSQGVVKIKRGINCYFIKHWYIAGAILAWNRMGRGKRYFHSGSHNR